MQSYNRTCRDRPCDIDQGTDFIGTLLKAFFYVVDPTELNRQGGDIGEQYRNGIYYVEEEDKAVIEKVIQDQQSKYDCPVVTECKKLSCFYRAEEYHQDYLTKNLTGYCHINLLDAEDFIAEEMGGRIS